MTTASIKWKYCLQFWLRVKFMGKKQKKAKGSFKSDIKKKKEDHHKTGMPQKGPKYFTGEAEAAHMRRLVKSFYIKRSGLWPRQSGPAQQGPQRAVTSWWFSTICLFTTTIRTFHWSDLKLLCTTSVAEASFRWAANFLAETQDAGLGVLFCNIWHWSLQFWCRLQTSLNWGYSAWSVIKPVLVMVVMVWETTSLWARSSLSMIWDLPQKDDTSSSIWPVCMCSVSARCWLTDASANCAHVFRRGCLSMYWNPTAISDVILGAVELRSCVVTGYFHLGLLLFLKKQTITRDFLKLRLKQNFSFLGWGGRHWKGSSGCFWCPSVD